MLFRSHWITEHKERLKQASREAGIDYNAHAAAEWARLEDKTEWEELANADKETYASEKKELPTEVGDGGGID